MFRINYRTRKGTSNLSGKARIFLSCHQEDKERYREKIIQQLLEIGNYAIWFYDYSSEEDSYEYETVEEYIGNAQLLVIPMTNRLLIDPGRIAEYETVVANAKHIPILPIAVEVLNDGLFTRVFGNIHYLSPYMTDETGIPYEEKLKMYLENVLVGEQQAKMIQAAFRKKVFLSYRKKDRRIAERLIRMIHQQPSCQDVGIWYDELLKPGRDFNDEIKREIELCDVFVINVTPSVLEEGNYVKKEEFPYAVKNKKEILPVEMIPTDKAALSEGYPELPSCVNGEDGSAAQKFGQLLGTQEDIIQDVEKAFYLGLAYLDGFFTEKDEGKALHWIIYAAERGFVDATEKLGLIYREGKGVKCDMNESVKWRKMLVQQLEDQIKAGNVTEAVAEKYHRSCLELGQLLQREERNAEAEVFFRKMMALSEKWTIDTFAYAYRRTVCIMALADSEMEKGNLNQAVDMYLEVIKGRKELVDKYANDKGYMPVIRRALAVAYLKLGDCERRLGYYKSVLDFYGQCLALRTAAVRDLTAGDYAEYEARRDLAVIQVRLGEVFEEIAEREGYQQYIQQAYQYYIDSQALRIGLADELQTDGALRDLGVGWCRLAEVEMKCGLWRDAGEHLEKGLTLRKELADKTGSLEDRRKLAKTYELQARFRIANREEEKVSFKDMLAIVQSYQNGCETMKHVAEDTGSIEDWRRTAEMHTGLGSFYKGMNQPELATAQLFHSAEIYQKLQEASADRIDNGDYRSVEESAMALFRLGMADNTPEHRKYLEMSYGLWENLARLNPKEDIYKENAEKIAGLLEEWGI